MKPDSTPNETPDYTQPVAYDKQGRPLYAHPPQQPEQVAQPVDEVSQQQPQAPIQVVHMSRAVQPVKPTITDDVAKRHAASKKKYPFLNLTDGEYVISAVRRHPIGLLLPVGMTLLLLSMILAFMFYYEDLVQTSGSGLPGIEAAFFPLTMLAIAVVMGGFLVVYVYLANKFFLTNESVIQEIQNSIFSHHEQTVSLANIEDASYRKNTILQTIFDYGDIRLSTEGDETTYRFKYVAHPKEQIATLNNAVEAFKNGRPVDDN